MSKLPTFLRPIGIVVVVLLLTFASPALSYADAASDPPTAGTAQPTGVAASTYTYNSDSGLWENNYYTWNPTTKETLPKQALEYTYNSATGLWDSKVWEFHPSVNKYEQITVSVNQPPTGAVTHGGPAPAPAPAPSPAPTPVAATNPADNTGAPAPDASPQNTASLSSLNPATAPTIALNSSGGLTITQNSGINLNNSVSAGATSGNVLLQNNYQGGDATSGNAASIATIINLLQSTAGIDGSNLATFTKDIQGNVTGDLLIDPSAFAQPSVSPTGLANVDINSSQNSAIHNDIDLSALTGNATVDDNTHAGSATTGNAAAVANVVNLINSVIAANQSFVGVVNIYGNYAGNILVPTDSLNALLASNAGAPAVPLGQSGTTTATNNLTTESNQAITNNVELAAATGSATQSNNYHTGSATSGNALTNLTILNLTGHQVTAANSLLVFVNVLGSWVGVIMDAPAGTTSAALTGGAAAAANIADPAAHDSTSNVTAVQNAAITNNIKAHATSGNAAVTDNYSASNATSGNATASANVANVINSSFSLSHWFGVLFINVFGNWLGNFGTAPQLAAAPTGGAPGAGSLPSDPVVFSFTGNSSSTGSGSGGSDTGSLMHVDRALFATDAQYASFTQEVGKVLSASQINPTAAQHAGTTTQTAKHESGLSLSMLPIAIGMTGLAALGAEKIHAIRKRWTN